MRARGVKEVLSLVVARIREAIASDETLIVLARSPGAGAAPGQGRSLTLRELTADDADIYARSIGTDSARTFRARLSEVSSCYAVEDSRHVVHASWVTTECAWTRELRSYLCPAEGSAYVYESFTRAEARGRGVYPFALNGICETLGGRDIARVWVAVEGRNEASFRAIRKAGFEPVFEIAYGRRLGRLRLELPDGVKSGSLVARASKKRRIWLPGDGEI